VSTMTTCLVGKSSEGSRQRMRSAARYWSADWFGLLA
jgi:hypothetical protein